uniref:Uncharacterized protein n=2 Tax=Oryza glumipatula TaxID=40148 RepID=A0A0D9ZP56_9ORYZ
MAKLENRSILTRYDAVAEKRDDAPYRRFGRRKREESAGFSLHAITSGDTVSPAGERGGHCSSARQCVRPLVAIRARVQILRKTVRFAASVPHESTSNYVSHGNLARAKQSQHSSCTYYLNGLGSPRAEPMGGCDGAGDAATCRSCATAGSRGHDWLGGWSSEIVFQRTASCVVKMDQRSRLLIFAAAAKFVDFNFV